MKPTLKDVYDYLHRREPKLRELPWERAERMLGWYLRHGLLLVIAEDKGVTAAAGIRRVDTREEGMTPWTHREDAQQLWVDWVGADSPRHMASLLDGVEARWPEHSPVEIHGVKARHGDIPRVLNFRNFARKLRHF